jgi:16S rRNA (uracil1498-N3)-methyltransferase
MNLLLIEPGELGDVGRVRLAGRRGRHLVRVLGAAPGRRLRAGVIGGATGSAEVVAVAGEVVEVRFTPDEDDDRVEEGAGGVDLVLALPRPKALRRILRLVATMGVRRLDLVNAWRVEKSFFDSPVLEVPAIRRELALGAEQGGTTRLPEVAVHRLLMPFLETLEEGRPEGRRLLAHPGAPEPIEAVPAGGEAGTDLLLAIGPEGGWIEKELASFEGLGFRPVTLGPWTLTTEAAIAVALGQLSLLERRG